MDLPDPTPEQERLERERVQRAELERLERERVQRAELERLERTEREARALQAEVRPIVARMSALVLLVTIAGRTAVALGVTALYALVVRFGEGHWPAQRSALLCAAAVLAVLWLRARVTERQAKPL